MNEEIYNAVTKAFDGTMMSENMIRGITKDLEQTNLTKEEIFNVLQTWWALNDDDIETFTNIIKQNIKDKIWLVITDWKCEDDYDISVVPCATKEKAREIFNKMIKEEKENSWISDYKQGDFDDYEETETLFNAEMYCEPLRTTIYIQEKEIEE